MNNNENEVILTIGIPVYNGAEFIKELLDSIIIPVELQHKVEILVSDNCSTDKTIDLVKSFPNVILHQNDNNIGYDENAFKIYTVAKGTYVWTIGSDDIILGADTISFIYKVLTQNNDIGVIQVGGSKLINNDFVIYRKDENFFFDSDFKSGFASSNIVNRRYWLDAEPNEFFGSGWVHFGVILKIVINSNCIITRDKLVDENPNFSHLKKTWDINGSGLRIMLQLVKIFENSKKYGYSKYFERKSKLLIKNNYPKEIIKCKANGLIVDFKLIKEFIKYYRNFISFWIIDLPFLIIPISFARFIYSQRFFLKTKLIK